MGEGGEWVEKIEYTANLSKSWSWAEQGNKYLEILYDPKGAYFVWPYWPYWPYYIFPNQTSMQILAPS